MKAIFFSLILLFLVQCGTTPKRAHKTTDVGIWQGKVLIENQNRKQKKWANVSWASDSTQNRMRVDVSTFMDIPVATFIQHGDQAHLWLFTEKKYYQSEDSQKLFQYLTKLSLNPIIFYSLLGRPVAPNSNWKCQDKSDNLKCYLAKKSMKLSVDYSDQDMRTIKVIHGPKALRLRLSRAKVQVHQSNFKLLDLSQFKTIQL